MRLNLGHTMKIYSIIPILLSAVLLSACGGSSGGDDNGDSEPTPKPPTAPSETVPGGTPESPAVMSLSKKNEISSNVFHNYFNYTAMKGERIHIGVTLETPLTQRWKSRCGPSAPGLYYKAIAVNGVSKTCNESLSYTFPSDGTYTFSFGYPDSNSGYFEADVTSGNPVVSDLNGTYNFEVVPSDNTPGGCSEGNGSMVLNNGKANGSITDVNTAEVMSFNGSVAADGFLEGSLSFSFGSNGGSISGLVSTSGSGDGTWKDLHGCLGDWTAKK